MTDIGTWSSGFQLECPRERFEKVKFVYSFLFVQTVDDLSASGHNVNDDGAHLYQRPNLETGGSCE